MHTSAAWPTARSAGAFADHLRGLAGDARERHGQCDAVLARPLERERQQELEPRRARLRFAERHLLAVVVHRRVVRAHEVDGAIGEAGAKCRAVARGAKRRNEPRVRREPADVDVGQVEVMNRDVARDRQALALGGANQRHALRARQAAQVNPDAGLADERQDGRQRDRLGEARDAGEPQAGGDLAVMRDSGTADVRIVGTQPEPVAEGRRVLHRAPHEVGVDERDVGLRERDAARLAELAHLGERRARKPHGERADGIDVRLVERARAVLQHLDQSRLVERRIGIGRAREARHAARDGRRHFRLECRLVLEPRLAQAGGDVDEPGSDHEPACVDDAARMPAGRRHADGRDLAGGDVHRRLAVDPVRGIDQAAVGDFQFHRLLAIMLITAMRTAMPNVTCGRITARSLSATAESISTPRFIGPGCITIASGLASASLSCVRP